jgi:hypothetical protein
MEDSPVSRAEYELFILSFVALFLEMMLIRWVPSICRLVAYYANLMLISSFLGLGIGAMASQKHFRLDKFFPPILLAFILFLMTSRRILLPGNSLELRFFMVAPKPLGYLVLIAVFFLNVLLFAPLGQRIGQAFDRLPPLKAYRWDLLGSLAGTLAFALFSYLYFSPIVGFVIVMLLFGAHILPVRHRPAAAVSFLACLLCLTVWSGRGVIWSPYYHITIVDEGDPSRRPVTSPPPNLRTAVNPPFYTIQVNQDFYQTDGSMNPARYVPVTPRVSNIFTQYTLPYRFAKTPHAVLIVGAGGGVDAEAALLSGADRIDAVEIDPVLVNLGRRFNAGGAYDDPKVHVQVDDARAFFQRTRRRYDLIMFGFLDSQALFSSMSTVRLDGFVYTVESLRAAYGLLTEDGVLCLSFMVSNQVWLVHKLYLMLQEGTGKDPVVYVRGTQVVFLVGQKALAPPPMIGNFRQVSLSPNRGDLATDDWPYLYLARKGLPLDYLIVIGTLTLLSLAFLHGAYRKRWAEGSLHFLFLGLGFMLLETKSIIDCSLYLGATWLVVLLIVAGVLIMILGANELAVRIRRFRFHFYLPLFVALTILLVIPRARILAWPLGGRLAWTLLAVPLPILFAGIIFSTTFREAKHPSAALAANLMGATLGGFAEYLGLCIGYHKLSLLVFFAYAASFLSFAYRRGLD